jgi:aminopeptidase
LLLDPRIVKMAQVLVGYSLGVQRGWVVTVSATPAALPLVQAVCREVIVAGAHPYVLLEAPGVREILLQHGNDDQLTRVDPYQMLMVEHSDAILRIKSEDNTRSTSNVDPARQGLYQKGSQPVGAAFMQRIMDNRPHCLTLYPTNAYAQDAEMSLTEWEDFVFRACLLDGDDDPVARWLQVSREQQHIVDWLDGKKSVQVEAPGTDLRMSINSPPRSRRAWKAPSTFRTRHRIMGGRCRACVYHSRRASSPNIRRRQAKTTLQLCSPLTRVQSDWASSQLAQTKV